MRRVVAVTALVLVAVALAAAPASAHAELESTSPSGGAVLTAAPRSVSLKFSEPVSASTGAVRVFNDQARRLDDGRVYHLGGAGEVVAVDLPSLADGAYVVTWRVISADSHPIRGAFTFRVGQASGASTGDAEALSRRLLDARGGSPAVGVGYGIARLAVFLSIIVLVGASTFVAWLWPNGTRSRAVRRTIGWAWVSAVVATIAGIGLQGAYGAGLGLTRIVDPSVVADVLGTRFGHMSVARLVLLAVAVPLLLRVRGVRRPSAVGAAGLVGAGVLLTISLAGHAGSGDRVLLAAAADVAHLGAVSIWLGGIAVLVVALLPANAPAELESVVPRFSRVAFAAVVAILATGTFQGWRQVGSLDALRGTTYGRLLLVKLGLFVVMVALAAVSRSWVRRRYGSAERLRRSVGAEAVVALAILTVTSLLVNAVPAKSSLARPFSTSLEAGDLIVDVTVDPAKAGPVDVHLYTLTRAGAVTDVPQVTATFQLGDIGPIDVRLQRAGPGHFSAYGFDLPVKGRWVLEVVVRTTDIDQFRAVTRLEVR